MRQNNKRAFTLVEVLIVIVIIGILFIVLMANVDFSTDEAKETGTKAIMQSYKLAAETIALENSGFTNDKAELVKVLNKRLDLELQLYVEGGEIKSKQTDSWGKEFKFMQSTPVNTYGMFAIQSAGPDGLFDNGDDIIMENKYVVVNGVGQVVTEFPEIDPNHSHSYVLRVTEPLFLKSPATCQSAAVYYYSCDCGKMNGTEFDFGVPDPEAHGVTTKQHIKKVPVDYAVHKTDSQCSLCGTALATVENPHRPDATGEHCVDCGEQLHIHIYDKEIEANQYKKNDANCTEPLTYFKSCECGAASPDEIFTKGTALGHDFTKKSLTYKISDSTCRDYAKYFFTCQRCDAKSETPFDHIDGGKSETNHVGGTHVEYTWVDDLRHIKDTICNGCGAKRSSITEPHVADGECCHTHTYSKCVESPAYEKTALTCTSKAVYYKSCECGKSSQGATNETFEGSATPTHLPATTPTWNSDHSVATISCTRSGCSQKWTSSSVNQITTTTATCVTERQYKHRASINVNGTSKTFDCTGHTGTTNSSNHLQDPAYPKIENICKWYPCCETVIDDTHSWNVSAANCQTAKKCTDCGFVAEEATDHSGSLVFANIAGICQKYSGCGCTYSDHDLGSAACTTAASCKRSGCSYSSGSPSGHLVNTSSAMWSSDHSSIKFICSRPGCSSSWDLSTTETVTTTANCVTAKQYKHTLTVSISGNVTIVGNTSLECTGHTGSVNPSTHASGCVWEPVSSPTSTLCQKRSKCGAQDTSHDYNVSSITCGSSVSKKYCTTCDYVAQTRPDHTPVNGGKSNVHKKCSVCNAPLEDGSYHDLSIISGGETCDQAATYGCACGYSYNVTGGSHKWKVITPATCFTDGTKKCTKCNEPGTIESPGNHNFPTSGEPNWNGCNPYYTCTNRFDGPNNTRIGCTATTSLSKSKDVTTSANCITYEKYRHKTTQGGTTYYCGTTHTGEKDPGTHPPSCTLAWKGVKNICQYRTGCGITTKDYDDHVWNVSSASYGVDKKCTNCGYVDEYGLVCPNHNYVVTTSMGSSVCKVCKNCGDTKGHNYSTATCQKKSTCSGCGKTSGDYAKHKPINGGSITQYPDCTQVGKRLKKCSVCGVDIAGSEYQYASKDPHTFDNDCDTTCNSCGATRSASHKWNVSSPSCTVAQYCTRCNASGSAALGHNFNISWSHDCTVTVSCKRSGCNASGSQKGTHRKLVPSTCGQIEIYDHVASFTVGGEDVSLSCGDRHEGSTSGTHNYSTANCYKPATCSRCGATSGSATGVHSWTNDCDTSCNTSGCTKTRTITHAYVAATCTKPKTCATCGATTGNPNGHSSTTQKYNDTYHIPRCTKCSANTGSIAKHSLDWSEQNDRQHLEFCKVATCTYQKYLNHSTTVTSVTAHPMTSGHDDTHTVTRKCGLCGWEKTYKYESCTSNGASKNPKCKICGQGLGGLFN